MKSSSLVLILSGLGLTYLLFCEMSRLKVKLGALALRERRHHQAIEGMNLVAQLNMGTQNWNIQRMDEEVARLSDASPEEFAAFCEEIRRELAQRQA